MLHAYRWRYTIKKKKKTIPRLYVPSDQPTGIQHQRERTCIRRELKPSVCRSTSAQKTIEASSIVLKPPSTAATKLTCARLHQIDPRTKARRRAPGDYSANHGQRCGGLPMKVRSLSFLSSHRTRYTGTRLRGKNRSTWCETADRERGGMGDKDGRRRMRRQRDGGVVPSIRRIHRILLCNKVSSSEIPLFLH